MREQPKIAGVGLIDSLMRFLSEVNRIDGFRLGLGNSITTFYGVYLDESRFQAPFHGRHA